MRQILETVEDEVETKLEFITVVVTGLNNVFDGELGETR
jgi:hypothetical protein